jgi:hypothetical protein
VKPKALFITKNGAVFLHELPSDMQEKNAPYYSADKIDIILKQPTTYLETPNRQPCPCCGTLLRTFKEVE